MSGSAAELGASVVGAGRFGRALAGSLARSGKGVRLWSRREREAEHEGVQTTTSLQELCEAEVIFWAVPSLHSAPLLDELAPHLGGQHKVVHASRGLVGEELTSISTLIRERTPVRRLGALAGPLSAAGMEAGDPAGAVVGSDFPGLIQDCRTLLAPAKVRLYGSSDLRGVELGAAATGLLLFALGFAQGLGFGPALVGVLASRGIAEMARLVEASGGQERTVHGLACAGDLMATLAGAPRPELELGRTLAHGRALREALAGLGAPTESVKVADLLAERAEMLGIDAPVASTVAALINGRTEPEDAVAALVQRPVGPE